MQQGIRIVVALLGLLFLVSGLRWLLDPAGAAEALGMPLLDGLARSTQIGDLGAFFLATSAMTLLGAVTRRRVWLLAASLLVGGAALMRLAAWLLHDATLATTFIAVEVVVTAVLLVAGARLQDRA